MESIYRDAYVTDSYRDDEGLKTLFDELADRVSDCDLVKLHKIADYVRAERMKVAYECDLEKRGPMLVVWNGAHKNEKENPSGVLYLKYCARQDKILKSLGLDSGIADNEPDDGFGDL